jgi:hypothetical protein
MKVKESFPERTDLKRLEVIPGIGKSLSRDLWRLGIREVADLKGKNPLEMYERLSVLTGIRQDPCVLYTFRCAVYFASEPDPRAEKLQWWYWKDRKYGETGEHTK